jgi:hypothetical protein
MNFDHISWVSFIIMACTRHWVSSSSLQIGIRVIFQLVYMNSLKLVCFLSASPIKVTIKHFNEKTRIEKSLNKIENKLSFLLFHLNEMDRETLPKAVLGDFVYEWLKRAETSYQECGKKLS